MSNSNFECCYRKESTSFFRIGSLFIFTRSFGHLSIGWGGSGIMRYCTDNGIELVHICEDKGISGAKVDEEGHTVE